ncbi:hypothetical protein BFW01_g160 [Lasiodiplodia theobromae]|uniref:Nuclear pore protein n=1 Tax=Lasiodiplodia theobromae TaxID=45133 RepID=A0A5N5D1M0_9PEZI|nr:hypothetical protein DBV05_g9761 [Lasiodiplodia theobromae]KAF9629979.1 hypothetical protein BFW01_g160 [Lasiodiplodia theobromae]
MATATNTQTAQQQQDPTSRFSVMTEGSDDAAIAAAVRPSQRPARTNSRTMSTRLQDGTDHFIDDDNDTPGEKSPVGRTYYFDLKGDTRLLVRNDAGVENVFVASSKAMTLVCDAWDRMLAPDGHFKEAQREQLDEEEGGGAAAKEIDLPDDDATALSILLDIAHLRFSLIPAKLSFRHLLGVAVLAEKYGAGKAFQPWLSMWVNAQRKKVGLPGYEEWLWIAWAFGEQEIFADLAAKLVREVQVDDKGRMVNAAGKVLDAEGGLGWFPPDILESIMSVRTATIALLQDACYGYQDRYLASYTVPDTASVCCHCGVDNDRECDAMVLGSFIISLHQNGLSPSREDPTKVKMSIEEFAERLKRVELIDCRHNHFGSCNFAPELWGKVEKVLGSIPSPVLDSHVRHMERQKRHF